jgi:bacillithiol biosynthesis deacetylase BshB1
MTPTLPIDILAFGAHPDDVELGCAGTLLRHIHQGKTAAIVDLTEGELGTRGTVEDRRAEAALATKIMGITDRKNLGFKDGFFVNDEWHQREIIKMIRYYRPRIVLCNAPYDRHPDHGRGGQLVKDASFLAGLEKIKTQWDGLTQTAHRPQVVYQYVQAIDTHPDFVVDITDFMEKKWKPYWPTNRSFSIPHQTSPPLSYLPVIFSHS